MRSVTLKNNDIELVFTEQGFTPFFLVDVEGIYSVDNEVNVVENGLIDGGTYYGKRSKIRNVVLTVMDRPENVYNLSNRDILRRENEFTMICTEDGVSRVTQCYVESITPAPRRRYIISLICPDPYFYAPNDINVYMAQWIPAFTFPHTFDGLEMFGYQSDVRSQNIINDNAVDNIGMTITLTASGEVTNPVLRRVESDEMFQIGFGANPFVMNSEDKVVITTERNNKNVVLVRNGVEENINYYIAEGSTFFQLMRGDNHIGYSADLGVDNLTVQITYRLRYRGA